MICGVKTMPVSYTGGRLHHRTGIVFIGFPKSFQSRIIICQIKVDNCVINNSYDFPYGVHILATTTKHSPDDPLDVFLWHSLSFLNYANGV